ncbi:MAG: hypothetical protein OIN66_17585 [Candidatus Methanoperedens sp.]|nr:hypothetical protein [Candidatus Methanoperedens sp.]
MKDKIAVFSAILLGLVVGLFATVSLIIDAFMLDNLTGTLIDLVIMVFSYMTAWIGIRHTLMKKIADDKIDKEWDYKIAPLVNMLTDTVGRMNAVEMQLMQTSNKVDTTLDYMTKMQDMDASKVYIFPGASFKFIAKVLVLIVFTFSALVYVVEYPLSIVHYFILLIYLAWWALFTSEYKLFDNKTAWIWALAPIMTVPVGGIILDSTLGINNMVGILFLFLFIYAYLYYTWAAYVTVGFKLVDLKKIRDYIISHSDTYLEQKKAERKIDRKWIDAGIILCIALAGAIAVWILL